MRHILSLIALALLMQGCATVMVARGPSGEETTVSYTGTAHGAAEVMRADVRRYDAETTREVATGAVEHGQPVSIGATPHSTSVSTGYNHGSYGAYSYGQIPADVVFTPTGGGYVMQGTGASGSYLPVLSSGSYTPTSTPATLDPSVSCPPDKPATERTLAEEAACLRESVDWLIDREGSR